MIPFYGGCYNLGSLEDYFHSDRIYKMFDTGFKQTYCKGVSTLKGYSHELRRLGN